MTLAEFLTARLDEDELAKSAIHDISVCELAIHGPTDPRWGWECTCGWPERVLAEVEAKRRIVERAILDFAEGFLRLLALPYADHPDYDESWRP